MSLTPSISAAHLTLNDFTSLFKAWQRNDPEIVLVPQLRSFFPKHNDDEILKIVSVSLFNDVSVQRTIDKNCRSFTTYPYGFLKKIKEKSWFEFGSTLS